ncbi:hypothetical protein VNO77_01960 [Canavalia gladiata]|uniref:Pentatricopeptide repeat-containing protein n=1 Tax=Canavalia gladiata TaxID=3824 RepID=A0AAN9RAT7_CANGL
MPHIGAASIRRLCTAAISISKAKSQLRREFDPDKALEIYSSLSKHYSSPVTSRYAQDLTVRRLAKSRRFPDIVKLLESQKSDPNITQEPFLSTLIRSYGVAGMFDNALSTYHQMDTLGTPRTSLSFNALLSSCILSGLFDKVPELFHQIPSQYDVVPDHVSYGILAKSFCQVGQPDKALQALKQAQAQAQNGVEITAVSYTTVLDALYKQGKNDEAEELWRLMKEKGCVDVTAFNVRIKHVSGGKPEEVKAVIDEMVETGLVPDTISYNFLMTCYLRCGMVKEGMGVYDGLRGKACRPNAATFRTSVFYLCRNEEFEEGYRVFQESVKLHKIPDFNTTKMLVEGLVKKGNKEEAKELVRIVKNKFPRNVLKAWSKVEESLNLAEAS